MAADVLVRVEGLRKAFDGQVVLQDVSFELRHGETLVILGESGSGKSVLVSCVVGLLSPDVGRIWIGEDEVTAFTKPGEWERVRGRIGFLFQGAALYDSMTVGENVAFPLVHQTDLPAADIARIVTEKLAQVGLEGVEDKMPSELSGGMQKRVGLARAIALDPELIVYDEPTTGLDPLLAETINDLVRQLQRELGVSSLVITHDMICARAVADRVAMLFEGRLLATDVFDRLRDTGHPYLQAYFRAAGLAAEGAA